MGKHNDAVRSLIKTTQRQCRVKTTKADHVDKYPDPDSISGYLPDIVFEFTNGRTRIIEVDTKPMRKKDKRQNETFKRSAAQRTSTTHKHYFASDII